MIFQPIYVSGTAHVTLGDSDPDVVASVWLFCHRVVTNILLVSSITYHCEPTITKKGLIIVIE